MIKRQNVSDLSKKEFHALYNLLKGKTDLDVNMMKQLEQKGFQKNGMIIQAGIQALKPYKVDNAIILAAGYSSRCHPLSKVLPKALFEVRGEIMIERQIEQIKKAGITNIIVVVGYKKEQFLYLQDKYNVKIVYNPEYKTKNNLYSLWSAREYLGNSFICAADNYYMHNVFSNYVYESYYACKYSEKYLDEYFVETDGDGYITKVVIGGRNGWYTMGQAFFSKIFSNRFIQLFEKDYNNEETYKMNWDDFHMKYPKELVFHKEEYSDADILEFDCLREVQEFDKDFDAYIKQKLS